MKKLLCLILLLFIIGSNWAQQFNFQNYSVGDGLAQSQVYTLFKDSRGCIWMGTQGGGVSCFDGLTFKNFSVKNGLSSNYVSCIIEDYDGRIIIGTSEGINVYDGLDIKKIHPKNYSAIQFEAFALNSDSTIFCATSNGVFTFKEDVLIKYEELGEYNDYYYYDVLIDTNKALWFASDNGLVYKDLVGIKKFTKKDGLRTNLINTLEQDSQGTIWIATHGYGVVTFKDSKFTFESSLHVDVVYDFIEKDGKMWMGTLDQGLLSYDLNTGNISRYTQASGLPNNQVRSLAVDDWGSLWLGTSGGGVSCYSGQQFQYFSRNNGLVDKQVYSIVEDEPNSFIIGNGAEGVLRFYPDSLNAFRRVPELKKGKVKALHKDSKGRIWAGTSGEGIFIIEKDTVWQITQSDGLTSDWIKAFEEDGAGNIYVATSGGGINIIENSAEVLYDYDIEIINSQSGLNANRISDLIFDNQNRLWFATTSNGFGVMMPDKTVLNFGAEQGLTSQAVRSVEIDNLGWLWIGTADNGISRMNLNADVFKVETFQLLDEEFSKNIYFLQFDGENHLWYGTESGLNKVVLDDNRNAIDWLHFGKDEGFFGIETCTNASLLDHQGNLWFGTIDGMNRTNPKQSIKNDQAPKIRLENISLFYKPLSETHLRSYMDKWGGIKDTLILTYQQNHLSFEFIGINLPNPEKVKYQWILEGSEAEWSPLSTKNNISYSNLRPGEYTFKVIACNEDGICNQEPKKVHFKILAPFWQKLKYQVAFIVFIVALLALLLWWRIREIKKKARGKNERLTLEKNLIELEQKALRLQMNPHFIFNSLNSIQGLIAKDDPKSARLYLSRFSRLMRQTLENSREGLISIEEEMDALTNYLDLERFTHDNIFDFEILSEVEDPEILIPPLLVQPFVENSIIHGVLPKGQGGKIKVVFLEVNGQLKIEIEDNGIGRKKSAENNSSKKSYHKSTGMDVTSERVEALGKNSKIEIIDVIGDDQQVVGTKVIIHISKNGDNE